MREEVLRGRMDATCRRFKGEETCGRYNLRGIRRRGSATIYFGQGTERRNMMTKSDTISEIMRINPTVNSAFLAEFAANQLSEYLNRLSGLTVPKSSQGAANFSRSTVRHSPAVTAGAA